MAAVGGLDAVLGQLSTTVLNELSPAAVGFTLRDGVKLHQKPSASSEVTGTVESAEMLAVLGKNSNASWLYIITITAAQGWVPRDVVRLTGNLADAPVVPDDPVAAFLEKLAQGEAPAEGQPAAETAASTGSAAPAPAVVQVAAEMPAPAFAAVASGRVAQKIDLRRGPGEQFGAVAEVTVDEPVTVLARSESGDWVVVEAPNGRVGWAPVSALSLDGSPAAAPAVLTGWVQSNELTVREGPGIYYSPVGKLGINELVAVKAISSDRSWVQVETRGGGRGWLSTRFLDVSGSLADVPVSDAVIQTAAAPAEAEIAVAPVGRPISQSVMVIQRESGGDILVIRPDGSGLRKLTTGIDPALSPDGQTVAFTRWQGDVGSLWLIGIDGSNERKVLDFTRKAKGAEWSPDGTKIAVNFQQGGRLEDKQECEDIDKVGRPPWNARDFKVKTRFTSDGDVEVKLCYVLPPDAHWNVRVVNLADGSYADYDGGTYAFRPAWDPARPWRLVTDGGRGLVATDLNNPAQPVRLTDVVGDSSPVFSPDGRYLLVSAGGTASDQGYDIYRLNADGSGRVRLTKTPLWVGVQPDADKTWNNVAPAWSPDGSQIAFLTDRSGRWEIWVMNPDGSNPHPLFSNDINDQLNLSYHFVDERVISWR
ncbi:MAG: hypothetical protein D6784_07040 [Chloroflexi bacterium]|nr:MAG: hypothetical protein D6784_07040 [Chloroflexota bacterium]